MRSETQGLNAKRLLLGIASKQLAPYIKENAPINLDWGDLYSTSGDLPGPPFAPRDAYRAVIAQYRQSPSGVVTLPPGDHVIRVLVFCTHGGVQRLGSAQARWHEQFALGPLRGKRAEALAALYARGAVQSVPYYPLQQVSWDITNGLKYDEFPEMQRALFDRLIPEYRSAVGESQLEQIQGKWRSLSSTIPGLPSLDQGLNDLGPVGQIVRDLQQSRAAILQNARNFDAETRQLAPIVGAPTDAPMAPQSWSKVNDRVYARMLVPSDYHGIGSIATLEMRVLGDQGGYAAPATIPISRTMAYPNCVYCQPLTLEPVANPLATVRVYIWNAKFPYTGTAGSVGHVYVEGSDGAYSSPFPANHSHKGTLENKSWSETLDIEHGRPATAAYEVTLSNVDAFNAALSELIRRPVWDFLPTNSNETNCVHAAYRALLAGGVKLGLRPLVPGGLEDQLDRLVGTGAVVKISPSTSPH
ncbi:MAG: hypothetical protein JWM87_2126 [Candidatus Eremiobacteraeota bacterium]|nr:hypothetical protein [Candidatus Eremiobacteraeota bacterium]